jgi:hypothetical protein
LAAAAAVLMSVVARPAPLLLPFLYPRLLLMMTWPVTTTALTVDGLN